MSSVSDNGVSQDPETFRQQAEATLNKYAQYKKDNPSGKERLIWNANEGGLVLRQLHLVEKFWNFFGYDMGAKLTQINDQLRQIGFDLENKNLVIAQNEYIKHYYKPIPNTDGKSKLDILQHDVSLVAKFQESHSEKVGEVEKEFKKLPLQEQFKQLEKVVLNGKNRGVHKRREAEFLIHQITEFDVSSGRALSNEDKQSIVKILPKIISQGFENKWPIGKMLAALITHFQASVSLPEDLCSSQFTKNYSRMNFPQSLSNIKANLEKLSRFTEDQVPYQTGEVGELRRGLSALPVKDSLALLENALNNNQREIVGLIFRSTDFSKLQEEDLKQFFAVYGLLLKDDFFKREVVSRPDIGSRLTDLMPNSEKAALFEKITAVVKKDKIQKADIAVLNMLLNIASVVDNAALLQLKPSTLKEAICLAALWPVMPNPHLQAAHNFARDMAENSLEDILLGLQTACPDVVAQVKLIASSAIFDRVITQALSAEDYQRRLTAYQASYFGKERNIKDLLTAQCVAAVSGTASSPDVLGKLKFAWNRKDYWTHLANTLTVTHCIRMDTHDAFGKAKELLFKEINTIVEKNVLLKEDIDILKIILNSAQRIDYVRASKLQPKNLKEAITFAEAFSEEADEYLDLARTFAFEMAENDLGPLLQGLQATCPVTCAQVKKFTQENEAALERLLLQADTGAKYGTLIEAYKAANPEKRDKINEHLKKICIAALSRNASQDTLLKGLQSAWQDQEYWKNIGEALVQVPLVKRGKVFKEAQDLFFAHIRALASEGPPSAQELTHLKACFANAKKIDRAFIATLVPTNFKEAIYFALLAPEYEIAHSASAMSFALAISDKDEYNALMQQFKQHLPVSREIVDRINLKLIWTKKLCENPVATLAEMRVDRAWQGDEYWRNLGVVLAQVAKLPSNRKTAALIQALVAPTKEFFAQTANLLAASGSIGHDLLLLKTMLENARRIDHAMTGKIFPATIAQVFCMAVGLPEYANLYVAVVRARVGRASENSYTAEIAKLKKLYPKFANEVNNFDFSVRFTFDKHHVAESAAVLVIPPAPAGFKVGQLMTIFEGINFHDSTKEPYYNPAEHFKSDMDTTNLNNITRDALREQLQLFVNRIKDKQGFFGTPPKDSAALKEYYETIEKAITNVLKKLSELGDTPEAQAKKAKIIISFIQASTHCGTAPYVSSLGMFKEIVQGKSPNYKESCLETLAEFRGIIAEGIPPAGNESVEHFKKFMLVLGKKLNLPMANLFTAEAGLARFGAMGFDERRDEAIFWQRYSASAIHSWLVSSVNGNAEERDKCIEWLKANLQATWSGKATFDAVRAEVAQSRLQPRELIGWLAEEPRGIIVQIHDDQINSAIKASMDAHFTTQVQARKQHLSAVVQAMKGQGKSATEIVKALREDTLSWLQAASIPTARNTSLPVARSLEAAINETIDKAEGTSAAKVALRAEVAQRLQRSDGSFASVLTWLKNEKQIIPEISPALIELVDDLVKNNVQAAQLVPLIIKVTDAEASDAIEVAIDATSKPQAEKEALKFEATTRLKQRGESLHSVLTWLNEKGVMPQISADKVTAVDDKAIEDAITRWSTLGRDVAVNQLMLQKRQRVPYDKIIADLRARQVLVDVSDESVKTSTKKAIDDAIHAAQTNAFLGEITEQQGSKQVVKDEWIAKMLVSMNVLTSLQFAR